MSGSAVLENAEITIKRHRHVRRWIAGVVLFLAVVAVALTVAWQSRLDLARRLVADALTSRGVSNASFRVTALGFKSIELRDLAIAPHDGDMAPPDVAARQISVNYRLGELLSGQVQSIEINGLQLNARVNDQGLSLGAADPLLNLGGGATTGAALPAVHIVDAALHLVTPQGTFDATGDADLSQADVSQAGASAPIVVALPTLRLSEQASPARFEPLMLSGQLRYDNKRLAFEATGTTAPSDGTGIALTKITGQYDIETATASAKANGQLAFAPGTFEPKDISTALDGLASDLRGALAYQADLSFGEGKLTGTGDLNITQASTSSVPFQPVSLTAHLQFDGKRLTFNADGRSSRGGVALAKITGHYDVEAASGAATAKGQLDFVPGKFAPQDLSPALKNIVSELQGRLAYQGDFSFAANKLASSGKVSLTNIGFRVGSTTVVGVTGDIRLSSLMPPQTRGVQTLSVAHVETVVPLDKGTVKFNVGAGMEAQLVEAAWPFNGGHLTLTSPKNVTNKYKLTVDKVDIAKLLQMVDLPGLSGTGTLSGTFPLKIVNGDPIITNGAISSSGKGVIIYNNEAADAAANTEQTQLLAQALKDFHYTELTGAVDGNINGNLQFKIGLRGANPALYDGYPIDLNVNLQGSLADLIRRGTVGLRPLELIQSGVGREKEASPE